MKNSLLSLFLLFTCATTLASPRNWWEKDPVFLSKDAVSVEQVIPLPPKAHSKVDEADILEVLRLQKVRTSAECERAKIEVHVSLDSFFGPSYGPLSADEVNKMAPFFEKVRTDTDYFVQAVKRQWKRPRPYVAAPEVHPCTPQEKTDSYPSGHAAISEVFARVLTLIDPSRKAVFETRANQISQDRILAGVHHPSDIEFGKKLGNAVFDALVKNKRFEQELKSLQVTRADTGSVQK